MKTKERLFWKWSPSRKLRRHRERQWWRSFDRGDAMKFAETKRLAKMG